eukprot:1247579-Pleurochrysis_carterae.AAC.1
MPATSWHGLCMSYGRGHSAKVYCKQQAAFLLFPYVHHFRIASLHLAQRFKNCNNEKGHS